MNILSVNGNNLSVNGNLLGVNPPPTPQLPDYTIRLKYKEGTTPTFSKGTGVLVDAENNIWDLTYENSDWSGLLNNHTDLLEVLGANTSNVTNMGSRLVGMFYSCTSLTSVPLFDTSKVTNMRYMFYYCTSLTSVPLFDTSNVTDMKNMFRNCKKVQSGALALYQQASTQTTPPTSYASCFTNCGADTQTGAAELAQIPTSWGGTMTE